MTGNSTDPGTLAKTFAGFAGFGAAAAGAWGLLPLVGGAWAIAKFSEGNGGGSPTPPGG